MKVSKNSQLRGSPASLSPAVQSLYPPGVVAADMRTPGEAATLFPAETNYVKHAVAKRVQEFAAGRACARRALAEFGIHDFVLLPAPDRQPIWPKSMVGSITHTAGYCVAVVGAREHFLALGVDSERVGEAGRELWPTICGPAEAEWCMSLPSAEQTAAATLLFSAKEAFYKCQFPLTGEWLDFHDLHVEPLDWGSDGVRFAVRHVRTLAVARYAPSPSIGECFFHDGLVTAGVAMPRASRRGQ